MKRLVSLAVVLVAGVTAAAAMAAPAPKATGDYGYSYAGVQRHLTFNAIQSKTDTCGTFWNVTGRHVVHVPSERRHDGLHVHHVTLAQNGQTVGGSGGYRSGDDQYHGTSIPEAVVGNTLTLTCELRHVGCHRDRHAHQRDHRRWTVRSTGTWNDNFGGTRTGTFTALAGSASPLSHTAARATPTTATLTTTGTS